MLGDVNQEAQAGQMSLVIREVAGIDEPVSLVACQGFAVGSQSNTIYSWKAFYEEGPGLIVSPAEVLEFDKEAPKAKLIQIISNNNQTAMLTRDGEVFTIDHNPNKTVKVRK